MKASKPLVAVCTAFAMTVCSNVCYAADMTWTYDEKTATVSVKGYGMINDATGFNQYLNKTKKLELLKGVTKIDRNVFVDCGTVEEVVLPDGFTDIGDNSFSLSDKIVKIDMPDTLETIGSEAFMGCTSLEDFTLPKSLKSIGKNAFGDCESINEFKVSEDSDTYKAIDGVVFSKDGSELVLYPPGREDVEYTVPDGVKKIQTSAFAYNAYLENVKLPDSVEEIADYAFFFSDSIKNIELGCGLKTIGNYSFYGTKLRKVSIPYGAEKIGDYAFKNCDVLNEANIPGTVTEMGENVFYGTSDNFVLYGYGNAAKDDAVKENKPFYETVRVMINGKEQEFDTFPVVKNGCTMVPMRKVFEVLGASVTWDDDTQTAYGTKDDITCGITVGDDVFYKNGTPIKLDAPAEVTNDRTLVHIRAVAETFGAKVGWKDNGLVTVIY